MPANDFEPFFRLYFISVGGDAEVLSVVIELGTVDEHEVGLIIIDLEL